jgi:arsenate reductase
MATKPVLYHNPRCTKSRQALALLEERGVDVTVVEYLKTPPTAAEVTEILRKLGGKPAAALRKGEDEYGALGLSPDSSAAEVAKAIAKHPILLERPVLVVGARAVIGRPPERVLELL